MNKFPQPLVTDYQDALRFLQDYYSYRKETDGSFSYETWAQEIKYRNRSYLRFVVLGKRPINESLLDLFLKSFSFIEHEAEYFTILVHYTQSKYQEQRSILGRRLIALAQQDRPLIEAQEHYDFLSNPILPKLQTIIGFEDINLCDEELAKALDISLEELGQALKSLETYRLIEKDQSGKWCSRKKSWSVPAKFQSLGLIEFYKNSLHAAEKAISSPSQERRFRSLFVAMKDDEFKDFLTDFEEFVKVQLQKRDVQTFQERRLYQLNFNFIPASKKYSST